jgi:serine/threonine-protein kinase
VLKKGLIVANKYLLERRLGRGGMGDVWAARHVQLGSPVALKIVDTSASTPEEARRRFEREARIAANLRSEFIVRVFDHGQESGFLFMAMELLEGEDLRSRLTREPRLPPAFVARVAVTVGRALRAAHGAGLVHRDLKPANVFLARQDDDEVVKVLDFGIVKVQGAVTFTSEGQLIGTIRYMSPEHLRDASAVDHRADLWSLSVLLYTSLTGEHPFPGDAQEVFLTLAQDPIPPPMLPSRVAPDLSPTFDAFFSRAFAAKIEHRFQTAAELVETFCWAASAQQRSSIAAATQALSAARPRGSPFGVTSIVEDPNAPPPPRPYEPHGVARLVYSGLPPAPSEDSLDQDGDRYVPMGEIGRGGMGRVDAVLDRVLGRTVARKSVLDLANADLLWSEAQIGAQLEHPSIVPVYDIESDALGPRYTMRVVRGRTLRHVLEDRRAGGQGAMSLAKALGVLSQVCLTVDYAHSRHVIHRDLKPENVIIGPFGEVYVIDWGLAYVAPSSDLSRTGAVRPRALVGTPGYMAPEQMGGAEPDARTDVYALGTMLREVLLSEPGGPAGPRSEANSRPLPAPFDALVAACRSPRPEERPASARLLADAIDAYLDSERERADRRRDAEMHAREGEALLAAVQDLAGRAKQLENEAEAMLDAIEPWEPSERKQPAWQRSEEAGRLRAESARALARAETAFARALGRMPDHAASRRGLAAIYYRQFEAAEEQGDRQKMAQYLELARAYDAGDLALELHDEGVLTVATEPPGARVSIARYEERGMVLRAEQWSDLGVSPVADISLPSGSYLLVARAGEREIRYPLRVERARRHALALRFANAVSLPPDMVLVPGGPFLALPPRGKRMVPEHLPDFAIARFPVTLAEYIYYLASIEDPAELARRTPLDRGVPLVERTGGGEFRLRESVVEGEGRKRVPEGRELDLPVLAVSWYSAVAYAKWLSEATNRPYRLPTDLEWEKAARGADGRAFPMGNWLDPSFAKLRTSRPEATQPEPVGAFALDVSPCGVRDLAGGVGDWTLTTVDGRPPPDLAAEGDSEADEQQVYYRGGNWGSSTLTNMRYPTAVRSRLSGVGFRVALSLDPGESSTLTVTKLRP